MSELGCRRIERIIRIIEDQSVMRKRSYILMALLAISGVLVAQEGIGPKTDEFRVGLKTGRTFFTNPDELGGQSAHVFYGQAMLDYGKCRGEKVYYGIGIGAEYIDMVDMEISIPLHLELRYYLEGTVQKGAFLGVQAGYVFSNQQSFPITIMDHGMEILVGQTTRKNSGPFGEVFVGYRVSGFDFFVSYDYRVVHYSRVYQYHNVYYNMEDAFFFKPLHTIMAGVSYKII